MKDLRVKQTGIVIPTAEGLGRQVGKTSCDCKAKRTVMLANAYRKEKIGPGI